MTTTPLDQADTLIKENAERQQAVSGIQTPPAANNPIDRVVTVLENWALRLETVALPANVIASEARLIALDAAREAGQLDAHLVRLADQRQTAIGKVDVMNELLGKYRALVLTNNDQAFLDRFETEPYDPEQYEQGAPHHQHDVAHKGKKR